MARDPVHPPHSSRSRRGCRLLVVVLVVALVAALGVSLSGTAAVANEPKPGSGVWPLTPRPAVVVGFHPPTSRWGPGHRGVDLAGRPGQAVRAAEPGRVVFAGRLAGRGVVVVDHGSTRTTYEPVAATVRVGDQVAAGAVLGRLELFGSHCFPRWCLHWGLIEGREHYLDPLVLVSAAPVVLLPLRTALPVPPAQAVPLARTAPPIRVAPPVRAAPPVRVAPPAQAAPVVLATRSPLAALLAPFGWALGVPAYGPPAFGLAGSRPLGESSAGEPPGALRRADGPAGRPVGAGRW